MRDLLDYYDFAEAVEGVVGNVERAIAGKREGVLLAVTTLLAGGHVLIEDVPGVGKTLLAKALARSVAGDFRRIQFTPDLLPADVTGTNVYNQGDGAFEFWAGRSLPTSFWPMRSTAQAPKPRARCWRRWRRDR